MEGKKIIFFFFVRYLNFELIENYGMLKTIDKKKIVKKSKLSVVIFTQ